ncbi:hypothetical protein FHS61_000310 [Altererythrobacter atlanticus]|uniref:Uncharacterized protein n=1 Tax=Croceibacterium atlanticum TaxID=1267766 RepID=A0A0F7KUU3_9SPHN|nr:hypothetical protein [Croceibacterium atlanticum]AKH42540.1 hypothetical protein WYH_01501 [Croceibacterium atlanticum]MBB5731317.1 hypothetical protein [Croceibacterium atlanticum]
MRRFLFVVSLCTLPLAGCFEEDAAQAEPASPSESPPQIDEAAIFRAAGFTRQGEQWKRCEDPGTPSYEPGAVVLPGDLNGDGLPEALVTEGGTFCFGGSGAGFQLLSQQADGSWKQMVDTIGYANFLDTTGADGFPDIEVGGPGFCMPVIRWDGNEYKLHRSQYQGKPCER